MARLENTPFLARDWLGHQQRDGYRKHGSVCTVISAAVLAIVGWHDGYRNTPAHLLASLRSPVTAIMQVFTSGKARPADRLSSGGVALVGSLAESQTDGADTDPAYRGWLMDSIAPAVTFDQRPGRWITEAERPSIPSARLTSVKTPF